MKILDLKSPFCSYLHLTFVNLILHWLTLFSIGAIREERFYQRMSLRNEGIKLGFIP
jgi:hypothetical protein